MAMAGESQKAAVWRSLVRHGLLVLAAFAMLYPLLWMAASSFKPDNLIFTEPGLIPTVWDFSNYAERLDGAARRLHDLLQELVPDLGTRGDRQSDGLLAHCLRLRAARVPASNGSGSP